MASLEFGRPRIHRNHVQHYTIQCIVVYINEGRTEKGGGLVIDTNAPNGWYPDPTGAAQQRYWDGEQWTAAIAAPAVLVPVVTPPQRDWAQRHPFWTALLVFWLACMLWQWTWLAPTLAAAAAIAWAARWERRRRARLAEDADRQNVLTLEGDPRGFYGNFPPTGSDPET